MQMLGTRQWYLIYFSFSVTISLVLLFGAQMKLLAREYDLPAPHFSLLLVLFPLANGVSRVLAGHYGSFTVPLAMVAAAILLAAVLSLPRFLHAPAVIPQDSGGGTS
jgi:hypothetical protein